MSVSTEVMHPDDDAMHGAPDSKELLRQQFEAAQRDYEHEQTTVDEIKAAVTVAAKKPATFANEYKQDGYWSAVGSRTWDFGKAPVRGVISAGQEILNLVGEYGDKLEEITGHLPGMSIDSSGVHLHSGEEYHQLEASGQMTTLKNVEFAKPQTDTKLGNVTSSVSQFLTGFASGEKELKAIGWVAKASDGTKAVKLFSGARVAVKGALADFQFFDGNDERVSNLINEYPSLRNPLTEWLAAKDDDSEMFGRVKNAVEGLGLGLLTDAVITGLRITKSIKLLTSASEEEAAGIKQAGEIEVKHDPNLEPAPKLEEQPAPAAGAAEKKLAEVADPVRAFDPEAIRSRIKIDTNKVTKLADSTLDSPTVMVDELKDFNVEKFDLDMNTIEDANHIRSILETTSEVFDDVMEKAKGGVQSNKVTARLAELVGTSAERVNKLYADVRGKHGLAARILAAEQTMLASAKNVKALADAARKSGQAPQAMLALHKSLRIHAAIQAEVKGAQTEVARAMQGLGILRKASAEQFRVLDDVQRLVGSKGSNDALIKMLLEAGDLRGLNKLVRKTVGRRISDVVMEVRINGLLSGPRTLAANIVSNSLKTMEVVLERPLVAAIGATRRGVRSSLGMSAAPRAHVREVIAMTHGTLEGFKEAVFLPIREMAKTAPKNWGKLKVGTMYRSAAEGRSVVDKGAAFESLGHEPAIRINDPDANVWLRRGVNTAGSIIRAPSGTLMATDELFKTIAYRQQLHALATRSALEHVDALKLTGAKRDAAMAREMKRVLDDPPEDIALELQKFMRYQTFQSELGSFGKTIQAAAARHPTVRFVIPFVRTPLNIFKQGLERSPFAPILGETRNALAKGGVEADQAMARMVMGTGVAVALWQVAEAGRVTGGGKVGSRKNSERLSDVPPYSIKIGDTWVQYNRLDPWGMAMGLVADSHDFAKNSIAPTDFADDIGSPTGKVLAGSITIISKNMLSKTWAKGVMDLVNVLSDPDRYAQGWTQNSIESFMPYSSLLRNTAQEIDPTAREAFTWVEQLKRDIPGLSDTLPEKRDWLGDVVDNTGNYVNPVVAKHESDDPLRKELARLRFNYDMPDKEVGHGVPLNAKQYARFLEIRGDVIKDSGGRNLKDALSAYIETPDYKSLSDGVGEISNGKSESIKKYITGYNKAAKSMLLREDHELSARVATLEQLLRDSKFERPAE
jgi:hypothetical protein